jgi:hypothetical protein
MASMSVVSRACWDGAVSASATITIEVLKMYVSVQLRHGWNAELAYALFHLKYRDKGLDDVRYAQQMSTVCLNLLTSSKP